MRYLSASGRAAKRGMNAGLFHVADRVDPRQRGAAHEHLRTRHALVQREAGVVERRGAAAQDAHAPAGQCGVIDGPGGMRVALRRQGLGDPLRHLPLAAALDAGGQDDLACHQRRAHRQVQAMDAGRGVWLDAHQLGGIAHRQPQRRAVPAQVVHPGAARNLVQRVPAGSAVLRFPPGAEGERGHAQVDRGDLLGCAQRLHTCVGDPGAFLPGGVFVDHQHVMHALALQGEGRAQAALPGPDDDHVVHVAGRVDARAHPGFAAVGEALQVVLQRVFELSQAHGNASRRRCTILPISARAVAISSLRDASRRRCSSARIPALSCRRTQITKGNPKRCR